MRIAVDVMSGDNPPEILVGGALHAAKELNVEIVLIGSREAVEKHKNEADGVYVAFSSSVVDMEDDALSAVKEKQDSSMAIGVTMLKNGNADAFVSPGNTGALLSAASIIVRRVKGIRRAAIGAVVPLEKPFVIVDAGANVEVLPENLLQFAYMGALYAEKVLGIEKPRVGLLSNGTENTKGTPVTKEAFALLNAAELNFVGNIEARQLPFAGCDVITCDGFSGNIALKLIEGMGKFMSDSVNGLFRRNIFTKLAALACMRDIKLLKKKTDSREYGGAPLLGIAKPVIKAHGNSDALGLYNAIRICKLYAESGIINEFTEKFGGSANNGSSKIVSAAN